jgi:hypothetical protein
MPTDDANPDSENEIQFDAEPENGEELNLPVNQREVLTRPGEPEIRSLHDKAKRGNGRAAGQPRHADHQRG